jgi:inositol phosphorylceramide mannosyltransferase catalytic subunit
VIIPRVFHQIWVGSDPLPEECEAYRESWMRHHPEWEFRLWTDENLPRDFERREAYELLRLPAERADVIRLELLYRSGGVYVDLDFECLRPIDSLVGDVDFFTGYRKARRPNNALIGSVPGHPILAQAIREIRPRTTYGLLDKEGTGPLFWRRIMRDHPRATIFPQPLFYPLTGAEIQNAYAIHHQARTWQDPRTLSKRLAGMERVVREVRDELAVWQTRCERAEAELARLRAQASSGRRIRDLLARR